MHVYLCCRDPSADVAAFKDGGGHVLVGTPGRLDDVMQRCTFMDLRTGAHALLVCITSEGKDHSVCSHILCYAPQENGAGC